MKLILAFIFSLNLSHAFANAFTQDFTHLNEGDLILSQASAELISVEQLCPKNPGGFSCMAYGSKVSMSITLNGCLDNFGGFFTNFEVVDGRGILSVGAINITNKASFTARCVRMPSKKVSMILPFIGKIELINVNYNGSTKLEN